MSGTGKRRGPLILFALVAIAICVAILFVPVSIRHNAPLGVSRTIDSGRGIAIRGGYVTPNYDDFNRLDFDFRAYDLDAAYDFVVHVRPSGPDAPDVRTISLSLDRDDVWHEKGAFRNPYTTVRFPAISNAAGQRYYVWVEAGPRNRDDIWTLWRIKSYSTVPVWEVARAWIESAPPPLGKWPGGAVVVLLLIATIGCLAWLFATLSRQIPDSRSSQSL